ncbi:MULTISPECIES: aminotransferase class V-fold PLP-dependent enzyme [unclassified Micromonospora]|uniref:aminotransferase class V-fold PLP-dependent enzyme n=1 Tax=unclassified Micromonospora TaxID=2617518 RepID=UPI001B36A3BA|nr:MULTISPECIES: aminotransferase class V-fold PLP-dependent enzyme [unclassified Micromonospora]MBQ1041046.1 aminotransferase class V-fold PLP-dependent enzyme [Micromonospora sp. C72]MBQ1055153.1 aminotransferase class V-fold PLP-dependent enzyme [Micromonospora sp. C32]
MSGPLERLLRDAAYRCEVFPVSRDRTFLAHAAVAPLPRPVVEAVTGYLERAAGEGQFDLLCPGLADDTRRLAADLLHVDADEIALSPSTSASLSTVAGALRWRRGDRILVLADDFPSLPLPWLNLREQGVEVAFLPYRDTPLGTAEVLDAVDGRTRLVVLSTAHFVTGRPVADLSGLGRALRGRSVLLAVDAIQTLGAFPLDARDVDFLAADGHKWLLAPAGMGVLYVRRALLDRLRVPAVGWHSLRDPKRYTADGPLAGDARRFEPGSLNVLGLLGLRAALTLLAAVGSAAVADRLRALRRTLVTGLTERGFHVPGADVPEWSGITAFRPDHVEADVLARRLLTAGVVTSVRRMPGSGIAHIRLAPHYYTADEDLERLWAAL